MDTAEVDASPYVMAPEPIFHALVTSEDKSTRQPSAFWKAVGYTLHKFFQMPGNMVDERQALFIASANQLGIPIGARYLEEVTNYQLYAKADKVQVVDHPTYSLERMSYYEMIYEWLRYTSEASSTPGLNKIRQLLSDAETKKEEEWRRVFLEYSQQPNRTQKLVDFIRADPAYIQAWEAEETLKTEYQSHLTESMKMLGLQLEITKAANDRAQERKNTNMPCIKISDNTTAQQADPKDIFYRPLHELENYYATYRSWLDAAFQEPPVWDGPYPISLAGALRPDSSYDWASLGHPGVDSLPSPPVPASVRAILPKVKVSMWFQGGAPTCLDVSRGIWDVTTSLKRGQLAANAPEYLRERFCKTTKLILAYGVRIDVLVPEGVAGQEEEEALVDWLPIALRPVQGVGGRYSYSAGGKNYPLLLGVVASLV